MTRREIADLKAALLCLENPPVGVHMAAHILSLLVPILVKYELEHAAEDGHWDQEEENECVGTPWDLHL